MNCEASGGLEGRAGPGGEPNRPWRWPQRRAENGHGVSPNSASPETGSWIGLSWPARGSSGMTAQGYRPAPPRIAADGGQRGALVSPHGQTFVRLLV